MVFILSALSWIRIRGLWKLPNRRDWLWGKLGLVLMGGAILSKSLTQFSVDGWVCVLSLLCVLRPTMVEVIKIMVTSFTMSHAHTATLSTPDPAASHHQPMPPPETPGHSQASLAQSLVRSLLISHGSWCLQGFIWALQESVSPGLCKFHNQIPLASKVKSSGDSQSLCQILRLGKLLRILVFS